jgi:ribosomal protein S18 acetylase RimI-like enzyme
MSEEPIVREIGPEDWSRATSVAARAFFDEEFVLSMLGREPLRRWHDVHRLYAEEPFDTTAVHLAAYVGDLPVGLVRASPFGACHVCRHIDPDQPPADELQAGEWAFEVEVQRAHRRHPEHAWISRVAVEPQLQGRGIGIRLVDAALALLGQDARVPVLLECLASREGFYLGRGFERVDEVVDAYAAATYLMRGYAAPSGT